MWPVIVLGVSGAILGLLLAIAKDFFYVEEDTRIEDVTALLPGYNCGACGFPGCSGFAEGLVTQKVDNLNLCKPGKEENYNNIIQYFKDHPNSDDTIIVVKK